MRVMAGDDGRWARVEGGLVSMWRGRMAERNAISSVRGPYKESGNQHDFGISRLVAIHVQNGAQWIHTSTVPNGRLTAI